MRGCRRLAPAGAGHVVALLWAGQRWRRSPYAHVSDGDLRRQGITPAPTVWWHAGSAANASRFWSAIACLSWTRASASALIPDFEPTNTKIVYPVPLHPRCRSARPSAMPCKRMRMPYKRARRIQGQGVSSCKAARQPHAGYPSYMPWPLAPVPRSPLLPPRAGLPPPAGHSPRSRVGTRPLSMLAPLCCCSRCRRPMSDAAQAASRRDASMRCSEAGSRVRSVAPNSLECCAA